jgi:hypothetical protein
MADFTHAIDVGAEPEAVRRLIAAAGDAWWTTDAVIDERVGGVCAFRFPGTGFFAEVIVERNEPGLVQWRCTASDQSDAALAASGGADPHEWVGTTIRFSIAPANSGAHVRLEHLGLGASAEFYRTKDNIWGFYLKSLKALAETGQGKPYRAA